MCPYRSNRNALRNAEAPREGLVSDMVRQFADPYAFLRELVQNSLDAGASSISIEIALDENDVATFAVTDDGAGMTRAIIEGPLLTLFSSSKDDDTSKIGKYGVGFVSVFAMEPEEVRVDTWRAKESWRVRLFADHHYDLERASPRRGSGTTVSVIKRMDRTAFASAAESSCRALRRWCQHAECPIDVAVSDCGQVVRPKERVNVPLGVDAIVTVSETTEGMTVIVGPTAGASSSPAAEGAPTDSSEDFAGFYNRGLTLFETKEPFAGLRGLRFKVQSPKLQHTISRDNVRRDRAFDDALDLVKRLAKGPLRRAVIEQLRAEARAIAGGRPTTTFARLFAAAAFSPLRLGDREITLPLTNPVGQKTTMTIAELRRALAFKSHPLYSEEPTPVTAALAKKGYPVVRTAENVVLNEITRRLDAPFIRNANHEHFVARALTAEELTSRDRKLGELLARFLDRAAGPGLSVVWCERSGTDPGRAVVLLTKRERGTWLCSLEAPTFWKRWRSGGTLAVLVDHPSVKRARENEESPVDAAHLLSRVVLLEASGALSDSVNDRLLSTYAAAIGKRA